MLDFLGGEMSLVFLREGDISRLDLLGGEISSFHDITENNGVETQEQATPYLSRARSRPVFVAAKLISRVDARLDGY